MAWSGNFNNPWSSNRWDDHPFWGNGPSAAGQGVDHAPDASGFPDLLWIQHGGGPWGGRRGWGGAYAGPWGRPGCPGRRGPHRSRGGHGHGHGHGPSGFRSHGPRDRDQNQDATAEPSSARPAPPDAGVTGDPDISTPDQLNDNGEPSGPPPFNLPFHFPPGHPFRAGFGEGPHRPPPPPHAHRGPHRGRGGGRHRGPPPPYPYPAPAGHPWAQAFHNIAEAFFPNAGAAGPNARSGNENNNANAAADNAAADDQSQPFTPPLDLFATPGAYVLHLALPGAKKSDIGVDWDPDVSTLRVAGVIHRPGDEDLLACLLPTSAERRVGYFERLIKLPPPEAAEQSRRWRGRTQQQPRPQDAEKESVTDDGDRDDADDLMDFEEEEGREEIDAAGITAKMEDGILIVTVPKVERGWTEVTKVDIE